MLDKYYAAENYHQNYYNLNKDKNPYCNVVASKLTKFINTLNNKNMSSYLL